MARICGKCNGSGWWGSRFDIGPKSPGGPCRACNGTGYDPNWSQKACRHCTRIIEYRINWSNIPDYCESCRQPRYKSCKGCGTQIEYKVYWNNVPEYCQTCRNWQEKACKNPGCGARVKYKSFWNNVPDYCESCRSWQEKSCKNPRCGGRIRYKPYWEKIPDYCDTCRSWQEKPCVTDGCMEKVRYKPLWDHPPNYCKTCKKLGGKSRDPWKDPRNKVEKWINQATGQINQKIVQGPDTGRHRYYDQERYRSGETSKERPFRQKP